MSLKNMNISLEMVYGWCARNEDQCGIGHMDLDWIQGVKR